MILKKNDLNLWVLDGERWSNVIVWDMKNSKKYTLIASLFSEVVNYHISSIDDAWNALKELKDLSESHFELELIQLQLKIFNLELKNDDTMALISKIKPIMHDIESIEVNINITLVALIKELYLTYLNYLESLQASNNLKSLTLDTFMDKIKKHEKAFGKKSSNPTYDTLCLLIRERILHMILLEVKVATVVMVGGIIEAEGRSNQGEERNDLHCTRCNR